MAVSSITIERKGKEMLYPDVQKLSEEELSLLCNEYRANNHIDAELSEKYGVKRGLRNSDGTGVLAGLTSICDVVGYEKKNDEIIPIDGKLIYRGIDLQELVDEAMNGDRFMFEEAAWLLLFGKRPSPEQLDKFRKMIEEHRELPEGFAETMIMNAPSPNIMNKMARSVLTMYSYDEKAEDTSLENLMKQSINLIAQMSTMMIYAYQSYRHTYLHESLYFHYPKQGLSTAEHILDIYRPDQSFTHEEAKLLDLCLLVHADHGGGNNSTFTNRVVSSTGSDTYSSVSAAIGSLKGPKHGGANLKVMQQLQDMLENIKDIHDDEEVKEYLNKIMDKKTGDKSGLIYGMGHAVYTLSDPRAQIIKKYSKDLAYKRGLDKEYEMLCQIERLAPAVLKERNHHLKNVCANVDLFSGLIYKILGIDEVLYTPIFAISRVVGWCAHRMEETEFSNRIIRPAYRYIESDE